MLTITGDIAREIRTAHIRPNKSWQEVAMADTCGYGCKIHVRRFAGEREYAILHSAVYGCPDGRSMSTVHQQVHVETVEEREATAKAEADYAATAAANGWGGDPDYLLAAGRY